MKNHVFGRGAKRDLREAARFYERESVELKEEFYAEVDRAVSVLEQNPFVGAPYHLHPFRKYVLDRFPYNLFYVAKNVIYVVALAHHSRKPDYWIDRTP